MKNLYAFPWENSQYVWTRIIYNSNLKYIEEVNFLFNWHEEYYSTYMKKSYFSITEAKQDIDLKLLSLNIILLNSEEKVNRFKLLI